MNDNTSTPFCQGCQGFWCTNFSLFFSYKSNLSGKRILLWKKIKFEDLPKESQEVIKIANYIYSEESEIKNFSDEIKGLIFKNIMRAIDNASMRDPNRLS